MPNTKKIKTKQQNAKKIKVPDPHEPILELEDEDEEVGIAPEDELDPEVIEALKLKNKKAKKPVLETDYIPELERGEFDLDLKLDEDY